MTPSSLENRGKSLPAQKYLFIPVVKIDLWIKYT